ncbi:MAG: hypothetical protein ACRD3T_11390 [Terriglobia bacterium]
MGRKRSLKADKSQKPYCFVSYSTREPHVSLLIECLHIVFQPHFEVKLTPSAFESGASQRDQITKLIEGCSFSVVALDGLRPNVVFEYGVLHGMKKPVILLREADATVDIVGFFRDVANLGLNNPPMSIDSQFSDVKDVNYAVWKRFEFRESALTVWREYCKKKEEIEGYTEIPRPSLCP